ncbi:MAG: electron transfer flavoprotein subunit alpha/FixB family protein [Candidatus Bathyarchaeota archaeon]|nr:electron transfer flavoprotein subunit alpha/FixB family protein [Candidatus Bathyarchaeota archaeon]
MAKNVLAFSEDRELLIQLLGKGEELAIKIGGKLNVLICGSKVTDSRELTQYGSKKTFIAEGPEFTYFSIDAYKAAVLKAVEASNPRIILIGATKKGKELAARVAAALDTGCMSECLSLDVNEEGNLVGKRFRYAGTTICTEVSRLAPHIATVSSKTFETPDPSIGVGEIVTLKLSLPKPKVSVIEIREKTRKDGNLESARVIIAAGRGIKTEEDLKILEELAGVLVAKVGCSRPIAADMGWMEEWIGISGRKVSPKLYLACGISGTIQHVAGIRESQIIVSINKDENASIHKISDYSIIEDLYTVLPALIKALKEKRG